MPFLSLKTVKTIWGYANMADPDLEEVTLSWTQTHPYQAHWPSQQIRKARLAQLRNTQGSPSSPESAEQQATASREAEARSSILAQILTPPAADRLNRIKLVRESRATEVENRLIYLARSGQLKDKVTEEQLKQVLGAMSEQEGAGSGEAGGGGAGKIQVVRKGGGWEEDDDDLLDLWGGLVGMSSIYRRLGGRYLWLVHWCVIQEHFRLCIMGHYVSIAHHLHEYEPSFLGRRDRTSCSILSLWRTLYQSISGHVN
jgi:programmed cell death protein 5